MHASSLLALAVAGLAAAQTSADADSSSTSTSGCGSQIDLIISSCLSSTKPQLLACTANDWDCLCTQSINVLTCYNNCPSSPDRFGQEQTKVANCNAASAYGTSSKATATGTVSAVIAAAETSATTTGSTTMGTESASASENASPSDTGAAVPNAALPAGGLLAAIFGLAALL